MIITRLCGGLGNQLFQYAMGRRLALRHDTTLKLDLQFYNSPEGPKNAIARPLRIFEFNIVAERASKQDLESIYAINGQRSVWQRVADRLNLPLTVSARRHSKERTWDFESACLRLPDNVHLRGYWQSEKYFGDIAPFLRRELTLKHPPDETNQQMLDRIQMTASVSLHVRRGDYVANPETNHVHGVCPLEYYHAAVRRVTSLVDRPHFFIFSDDAVWTQQNLKLAHPTTYVAHNTDRRDYEDLRLMSHCQHHIIANSSFSWWGAWLGTKPDKMVIAPRHWFNAPGLGTKDRIPPQWIRL